ncbi:MAG: hypothetical protein M0Z77_10330 [Thermoplasmatales archaeon]|jgi:hypothetical protein|nr:hypothetical protein [Candidatus Thermoplasmatota archaeon]MCL6003348.1 hypothetical protein [Candidatus Thermoplasmatota archaeon]MDA8056023.1 hypothetical protein [Thermoplasmatales archaeon]
MNGYVGNERQLKCYICGRNLVEVDKERWSSDTLKGGVKVASISHSTSSGEIIHKVLSCPTHSNFYLLEIPAPRQDQLAFDRKSLGYIRKSLGAVKEIGPSAVLGGSSIYYNVQYSLYLRLSTYLRGHLWKKEFSSKLPLDSIVLMISSIVREKHFLLFGIFDSDIRKFVIVNIIRDW